MQKLIVYALVLFLFQVQLASAQTTVSVAVDKPGFEIPSTLFGLFFEDINFGADGGLYPERIKNRSFEFPDPLMGWTVITTPTSKVPGLPETYRAVVRTQFPIHDNNAHYVNIHPRYGISNDGFRGIGVQKGAVYIFSIYARQSTDPAMRSALRMELQDENGKVIGTARVEEITRTWKKYSVTVRPNGTSLKARLNVIAEGLNPVDVDMVSLMPQNTWKNRPNGLRSDLVQLLNDMKPGFLRFPGGCIVEGRVLATRYQWKTTVGDVAERKLIINRWNDEFKHRPAPDYYQSFGLGFYEYFLLSEDIGAEPMPILNCGMACQFNSSELAPLADLDQYIQDAFDLIEFANSPTTTKWGQLRAALGHPAPFNLKMIGVGNEQWGPQYIERYKIFSKALKDKYPNITLITSAGPSPNDERFQFLWANLRTLNADIVDEHYYMAPKWFRDNVNRYDNYPRTGPKVFAGEYAAQSVGVARPENRNDWECALSEAAFMTGLVRNSDVVRMSSYAPLFAHVDAWQWTPDLIWFDNLRSFGSPNYYVQKLFSLNKGTSLLPVTQNGSAKNGQDDLYTTASFDKSTGEAVLILVNTSASDKPVKLDFTGIKSLRKTGTATVISSADLKAENSVTQPTKVAPVVKPLSVSGPQFAYTLAPSSVTVLRVGVQNK